jgi:naringenin degradation protein FdeH
VQVRWFVLNPLPESMRGMAKNALDEAVRGAFAEIGGAHHVIDQSRHPSMHETPTLDVVCLLQGEALMILEDGETRLKPGNVVIQRGTNHAWQAIDAPAFFVGVMIDRSPLS